MVESEVDLMVEIEVECGGCVGRSETVENDLE
jgi:hypothetical protein